MAYSRVVATGDGSTTQFAVNFALGFLLEEDVTCRVGTETDGSGDPLYRTITFLSENLIEVAGTPAGNDVEVVFERTVDKEGLRVDYNNGDQLDEDNLMIAQKQAMMAVHEVLDGRFAVMTRDINAGDHSVVNLREPVLGSDAATKNYVDDKLGDAREAAIEAAASAEAAAGSAEDTEADRVDTAADRAAADAALAQTIAARDVTLAAMSQTTGQVESRVYARDSYRPLIQPKFIQTLGDSQLGDLGDTLFKENGATTGDLIVTLQDEITKAGYDRLRKLVFSPQAFGADTTTSSANQRANIQLCLDFAPQGATIDLGSATFTINATLKPRPGQVIRGGGITLDASVTSPVFGLIAAADNGIYENLTLIGTSKTGTAQGSELYQAAIHCSTTAQSGRIPAKNVRVTNCDISAFTVGIMMNPATGEAVPVNWWITKCTIHDIVGYTGASEGYGISVGYGTNIWVTDCVFVRIKRHAVYYAGVNGGHVIGNDIQYVDNIAIQFNGYSAQPSSYANIIAFNRISNITRLVDYGYMSGIAIGIYGKQSITEIIGNSIQNCYHVGIDICAQSGDSLVTGSRYFVSGNSITMGSDCTVAGIRTVNTPDAVISGNSIRLSSAIWAVLLNVDANVSSWPVTVTGNVMFTTDSSAGAVRISVQHANGVVFAYNNRASGFSTVMTDASTLGIVRTDMNGRLSYYSGDADITHVSGGSKGVDAPVVYLWNARTAGRSIFLSTTAVPPNAEVTIINKTSGGFAQAVSAGGTTLVSLAANESARLRFDNAGTWILVMKGTA